MTIPEQLFRDGLADVASFGSRLSAVQLVYCCVFWYLFTGHTLQDCLPIGSCE